MKISLKTLITFFLLTSFFGAKAQKVNDIFVNLYTDSLKKGTHNYINVDGLMSNGNYRPLDSTKIAFSCPQAKFIGNSLVIPADFKEEKVDIKVVLKEDEKKFKEFVMYIKKAEDPPLRTEAEIMVDLKNRKKKKG